MSLGTVASPPRAQLSPHKSIKEQLIIRGGGADCYQQPNLTCLIKQHVSSSIPECPRPEKMKDISSNVGILVGSEMYSSQMAQAPYPNLINLTLPSACTPS